MIDPSDVPRDDVDDAAAITRLQRELEDKDEELRQAQNQILLLKADVRAWKARARQFDHESLASASVTSEGPAPRGRARLREAVPSVPSIEERRRETAWQEEAEELREALGRQQAEQEAAAATSEELRTFQEVQAAECLQNAEELQALRLQVQQKSNTIVEMSATQSGFKTELRHETRMQKMELQSMTDRAQVNLSVGGRLKEDNVRLQNESRALRMNAEECESGLILERASHSRVRKQHSESLAEIGDLRSKGDEHLLCEDALRRTGDELKSHEEELESIRGEAGALKSAEIKMAHFRDSLQVELCEAQKLHEETASDLEDEVRHRDQKLSAASERVAELEAQAAKARALDGAQGAPRTLPQLCDFFALERARATLVTDVTFDDALALWYFFWLNFCRPQQHHVEIHVFIVGIQDVAGGAALVSHIFACVEAHARRSLSSAASVACRVRCSRSPAQSAQRHEAEGFEPYHKGVTGFPQAEQEWTCFQDCPAADFTADLVLLLVSIDGEVLHRSEAGSVAARPDMLEYFIPRHGGLLSPPCGLRATFDGSPAGDFLWLQGLIPGIKSNGAKIAIIDDIPSFAKDTQQIGVVEASMPLMKLLQNDCGLEARELWRHLFAASSQQVLSRSAEEVAKWLSLAPQEGVDYGNERLGGRIAALAQKYNLPLGETSEVGEALQEKFLAAQQALEDGRRNPVLESCEQLHVLVAEVCGTQVAAALELASRAFEVHNRLIEVGNGQRLIALLQSARPSLRPAELWIDSQGCLDLQFSDEGREEATVWASQDVDVVNVLEWMAQAQSARGVMAHQDRDFRVPVITFAAEQADAHAATGGETSRPPNELVDSLLRLCSELGSECQPLQDGDDGRVENVLARLRQELDRLPAMLAASASPPSGPASQTPPSEAQSPVDQSLQAQLAEARFEAARIKETLRGEHEDQLDEMAREHDDERRELSVQIRRLKQESEALRKEQALSKPLSRIEAGFGETVQALKRELMGQLADIGDNFQQQRQAEEVVSQGLRTTVVQYQLQLEEARGDLKVLAELYEEQRQRNQNV